MIDYRTLKEWSFAEVEQTYTADDAMLYALAIGLGADPVDERQLVFVDDSRPGMPIAFPTLAVTLAYPGFWLADPRTGIDATMLVHGEELLVMHAPLPVSATVFSRHRVIDVIDKGRGKGAVIRYRKELFDRPTHRLLASITHTTFARGDGGFAERQAQGSDPSPPSPARVPDGEPHHVFEFRTLPQQALLYRLCADRNPLHSDPRIAREAGFERPILHGLATYGIAAHALLATFLDYDPTRLRSLFTRFSAPVFPGDTIRIEMYRSGEEIAFRARVKERDRIVLDYGRGEIA